MARRLATALKILLLIALSPLILVAAIIGALLGGTQEGSAEEVAGYLRDFLDGEPVAWDWDDFTSIPYRDPRLDSIARRAAAVDLPLSDDGEATLRALLKEVEELARAEEAELHASDDRQARGA